MGIEGLRDITVLKLNSYKDSDVGNLWKLKYFNDYFRHSRKAKNEI